VSWTPRSLHARIADAASRKRFAGGSPDAAELRAYAGELEGLDPDGAAVVLGMTPELRALAAARFASVLAVDASPDAIALYRDWLPREQRQRESVVCAPWRRLGELVQELHPPVRVVLGDGVFGNVEGGEAHRELLAAIRGALAPGGRFVTRHAAYPTDYDFEANTAARLLEGFRRGELDAAELGFGMRMTGHAAAAWRRADGRLRNAPIFRWCERARARGGISDAEHAAIQRYHFEGDNTVLPQDAWEALLEGAGFRWRKHTLRGRHWYAYYPVYAAEPVPDGGRRAPRTSTPSGAPSGGILQG